jgi:hypothetical protein
MILKADSENPISGFWFKGTSNIVTPSGHIIPSPENIWFGDEFGTTREAISLILIHQNLQS